MKKTSINKIMIVGAIIALLSSSIPLSTATFLDVQNQETQMVNIRVLNTLDNSISYHTITKDAYDQLYEPFQQPDMTPNQFNQNMKQTLSQITNMNLITAEQKELLENRIDQLQYKDSYNKRLPNIFGFDAINLFNGIFFYMKGEKLSSILDLYVFNYQFLTTNMSALFTGYSEFQGHGFIVSLGALAFQSVISYSIADTPHFSEIHGAVIGFTGVIIETEGTVTNPEGSVICAGLNVLTYWHEL